MRAAFCVLVSVSLFGCGPSQVQILEKQVEGLQKQIVQLRKAHATVSVRVEDHDTELFNTKDQLDTMKRQLARRYRQVQSIPTVKLRPTRPTPVAFDPDDGRPVATGPVTYDRLTDDGTVIRGGSGATAKTSRPGSPHSAKTPRKSEKNRTTTSAQRKAVAQYKAAFAHYKAGRYPQAFDAFAGFVESHPTHGHADNALYWMGECFYVRALWREALQRFNQVVLGYPQGNKVPDAMLKVGLTYLQLRNYRQAREVLQQVIENFPDTPIAKLAARNLEKIP